MVVSLDIPLFVYAKQIAAYQLRLVTPAPHRFPDVREDAVYHRWLLVGEARAVRRDGAHGQQNARRNCSIHRTGVSFTFAVGSEFMVCGGLKAEDIDIDVAATLRRTGHQVRTVLNQDNA
jgi:hypothetical protein